MKNLYFISGLGADKRAFEKLQLPAEYNIYHIKWVQPLNNESLEHYSKRLSEQIDTTTPFTLVGLSFGGIIAIEIAKFLHVQKIILISSISTYYELPKKYRVLGKLKLNKFIPAYFFKKPTELTYWLFGTKKNSERRLLKMIINDTPDKFLKWAIGQILHWRSNIRPNHVIHLHGDKDKLLPIQYTKADVIIKNAGHLMVYTHADEVSSKLNEFLSIH